MRYCEEQGIGYVLRAKRSAELKAWILERPESVWQPLVRDGEAVEGQATCRGVHVITGYDKAFTVVVQRTRKAGQQCLDLGEEDVDDDTAVTDGGIASRP